MPDSNLRNAMQRLADRLSPASKLISSQKLVGGMSAEMFVLEMELPDGTRQKVVVRFPGQANYKLHPDVARSNYEKLELIHALGIPTPAPLLLDESNEIFPAPYFVMEYIDGQSVYAPSDENDFLTQSAAQLAAIHRWNDSNADLSLLHHPGNGFPELREQRPPTLDESLADRRIRAFLETTQTLVPHNRPVLSHGDYWPGNLLWRSSKLVAVVDWEDVRVGEPLYDLAISRIDFLGNSGYAGMEFFTQQYQARLPLDYTHLPYWDLNAALRFARILGSDLDGLAVSFGALVGQHITAQDIRDRYHQFVAQAFEKLDIR